MTVSRLSPCKVNLLLNILGKRPDGFHELETVMHPVGCHDVLHLERAGTGIQLTCDHPELTTGPENLVHRAAAAFIKAAGVTEGVRIHLQKKLPLAAGLGGGSSNAAHTLLGLNELFGNPLSKDHLNQLAAGLGSDVPFFLQTGPALGTGRGEEVVSLEPFACFQGLHVILIHPGFGVSTAWAYQALGGFPEALNGKPGRAAALIQLLQRGDIERAGAAFYNSLEIPVLRKYPILALYQEFLRAEGALAALMSGSGSTTFALARNQPAAEQMLERFRSKFGATGWAALAAL